MIERETSIGVMDIPLSCSIFLEPALNKYIRNIVPLSQKTKKFVHEWNLALVDILKTSKYKVYLGDLGHKILTRTLSSDKFPIKCVESAKSVPLHSLHYALRFSESVNFLVNKIKTNSDIKFVDFGCGFSPLAPVMQAEYDIEETYCIDYKPEIIEVYSIVSQKVSGKAPKSISWNKAKEMAVSHKLNSIVAMGVLPYMSLDDQVACLKFINAHFPHLMVEIKYNNNSATAGENVFDLKHLQRLRLSGANTSTLETTMIKNSLRYLHKFMCAMPRNKYFLENDRSLFFSR